MTDITTRPAEGRAARAPAAAAGGSGLHLFVTRLHFYIGLFVGPFVLVAAVTGTLFVLTPQLEERLYAEQLRSPAVGEARPLAEQARAARAYIGEESRLFAVRPAQAPGWTTRVMYSEPGLGGSESRAVFVDPVTLEIRGDLIVYGTSGTLPFRTTIDYLHRNLLLGEFGRAYSELAASWLWIAALGGLLLWYWRRAPGRRPRARLGKAARTRRLHTLLGLWILAGVLFFSATGLTWSQWAGGRIDALRAEFGWVTPSVTLALDRRAAPAEGGAHAHHADHGGDHGADHGAATPPADAIEVGDTAAEHLDAILAVTRQAGLQATLLEIRPPRAPTQAWLVREVDRRWPTQVDTIAIDPRNLTVTSHAHFESFPLVAKLIRWGIDAHMGILFGLANQLLVAALGIALVVTILYGYRIWWQRRPAPGAPPRSLVQAWLRLSLPAKGGVALLALALGWALPLMGLSLLLFLAVDLLRWRLAKTG